MTNVQIFNNTDFGELRTIIINGEPWFVGKDVAEKLGYIETAKAIREHVCEEDKGVSVLDTPGGPQKMTVINESGLYSLILSSKLPSAKEFKHWVTSEVLPTIRRHGLYATKETAEQILNDPDFLIRALTELKESREEAKRLKEENTAQAATITALQPKADYCDAVLKSDGLTLTTVIAKDYGMSTCAFNRTLHELGLQYKVGTTWTLYQEWADKGYRVSNTVERYTKYGTVKTFTNTLWTQEGRLWLYKVLREHGILPLMEQKKRAQMQPTETTEQTKPQTVELTNIPAK